MRTSLMGSLANKNSLVTEDQLAGIGGPPTPLGIYCTNLNLQKSLLVKHKVSTDDLNFMVELFFGTIPAPQIISLTTIKGFMDTISCGVAQIDFIVDFTNTTDNSEISINPSQTVLNGYSYAFFQAIINRFNTIQEFHFFKAISDCGDNNGNSVVFQVVDTSSNILYCADLSGYEP